MKKLLMIAIPLTVILGTAACSNSGQQTGTGTEPNMVVNTPVSTNELQETEADVQDSEGSKTLIAYFTYPEPDGTDVSAGASRVSDKGEIKGSMQYVAEVIQAETGADLFEIKTAENYYPEPHAPLVDQAKNEQNEDARPELVTHIENLNDYDTIFIGYPNWWGDMPMPMYTFFDEYDFSGKRIIPFNSHGGSGFSGTIHTIQSLEPNADVEINGFTVSRNVVADSAEDIRTWIAEIIK